MMAKLYQTSAVRMEDLILKALDIQGRCKDVVLSAGHKGRGKNKAPTGVVNPGLTAAKVTLGGELGTLNFLSPVGGEGDMTISLPISAELTDWSLYQLCSVRLGVPHAFMRKCIEDKNPDIQEIFPLTVNRFMSHYDSETRIRLYKPEDGGPLQVRGIVSGSYAVFDSDAVLNTVQDVLGNDYNIVGHCIDESGLHLRLTAPEPLDVSGEDLYPGLLITSGDVGNRSLEVQFFLWKQVCTNGLVMSKMTGKVLHKRHLGVYDSNDFHDALVGALESFQIFCANAQTLVEEARRKELDANTLKERLDAFKVNVKLTEKEATQILELTGHRYASKGGVITLWSFVNALTEFAQNERFSLDARTEVEAYAGNLLMTA